VVFEADVVFAVDVVFAADEVFCAYATGNETPNAAPIASASKVFRNMKISFD
jgi:hypothetical protein